MKHDDFIRESLDQNLSGLHVSRQQQTDILNEIVGGEKMEKKVPFSFALVAILALMSIAALAVSTNVFSYFSDSDERYGKVAEQAANVTAAPIEVETEELGAVNARIDGSGHIVTVRGIGYRWENSK